MTVPFVFANTPFGTNIPLSQLDANFNYATGLVPVFKMEQLVVSTVNTLPALSFAPVFQTVAPNGLFMLLVNGTAVVPVGSPAPFTVVGSAITWASATTSVYPGDVVIAIYNH
jgi:hypothetical protein